MLDYKTLSDSFKPDTIRLLLVGEAPPDDGTRYFYQVPTTDADNLFIAVYKAIDEEAAAEYERLKRPGNMKEGMLYTLRHKGVFVIDLCPIPINMLPEGTSTLDYSDDFIENIKSLPLSDNCSIIIFKGGKKIQPLLDKAGYSSKIVSLSRDSGGKGVFIEELRQQYKALKKRK